MARARRQRRRSFGHRLRKVLVTGMVTVATLVAVLVLGLRWVAPPITSFMVQRQARAWWAGDRDWRLDHEWTDWEAISPWAALAIVAAEDQKFPEHHGFDLESIADAWAENREGRRVRGASTISQQVAKNLFLWSGRSYLRKGIEAVLTVLVELSLPKQRILEMYLNVAEFGDGIFGVGAASRAFFGKAPADLEPAEAALLAAVLPNPSSLHVNAPSAYVTDRRDWILDQMQKLGGPAYLADRSASVNPR